MQSPTYAILDSLLEGCQIIDPDWRYVYVNDTVAKQGRRPREELLGHTMMEMYPGIENTEMFAHLRRCMTERAPSEMENEFAYPDGSTGWFQLKIEPVPEGVFVLSIDISARKRDQQKIEQQLNRLKALRAIDVAILSFTDMQLSLKTVLIETVARLSIDAAVVMLFNRQSLMLQVAASLGFQTRAVESVRLKLGDGFAGLAALQRRTVVFPNLAKGDLPFGVLPIVQDEGFQFAAAVPLVAKGTLLGALTVFHRTPFTPSDDWLEFLGVLAGQAAMAVDSCQSMVDLQRANAELIMAYDATIEGWSRALDLRDKETEGHSQRVTELTVELAKRAGMSSEELVHVYRGALLHDIGKLGVPDAILLKPDKLTDEEWVVMRKHPLFAYELLWPITYLHPAIDIPYCHHEKWDGTGYPRGLKGEQIPLSARLFAIVDVWDALRSDRPYRSAWSTEKSLEYIQSQVGSHFDAKSAELFVDLVTAL